MIVAWHSAKSICLWVYELCFKLLCVQAVIWRSLITRSLQLYWPSLWIRALRPCTSSPACAPFAWALWRAGEPSTGTITAITSLFPYLSARLPLLECGLDLTRSKTFESHVKWCYPKPQKPPALPVKFFEFDCRNQLFVEKGLWILNDLKTLQLFTLFYI